MTIYDQFNRPYRKRKTPDRRPLAAAPILDSSREYVADGLTPQRLAALFRQADNGDMSRQADLFDQMEERDAHLIGEMSKRRNVITNVDFQITPVSDDRRDAAIAEFCENWIADQHDWPDTLIAFQDAVGKGYAGMELIWDVSEHQAVISELKFLEQKRFTFLDHDGFIRRIPLLITDENMMGEEIRPWSIALHIYGGKSGHPARSGIYRVCSWGYLFKHYGLKDWVIFSEVYGMPLRLGKYNPGAKEEDKEALQTALVSLGADAAGIISSNTEVEFITGQTGAASSDMYARLLAFCDKAMSKAVVGQTLSAELEGQGSRAATETHNQIREDLVQADARALASTARSQILRPLVGFNFGWDAPVPRFRFKCDPPEDLKYMAETYKVIADMGFDVSQEHISQRFNIPMRGKKETPLAKKQTSVQPFPQEPTELKKLKDDPPESPQDDLLGNDDAAEKIQKSMDALLAQVLKAVDGAGSFEEIGEKLYEIYPTLDDSAFQELLRRAVTASAMIGYAGAQDEI